MNTRDLAQQKAFEMLEDLNLDPDAKIYGCSILTIATSAFMRGWVHGLQDAKEIRSDVRQSISQAQCTTISHPGTSPTGFRCTRLTGHDGAHDFGTEHARHISLLNRQAG